MAESAPTAPPEPAAAHGASVHAVSAAQHSPFGTDRFGREAERFARFFGTPRFIIGQTIIVVLWIALNAAEVIFKPFDPYPFILLNLAFSTQAAYAAPLILLAQTRQADRDKVQAELDAKHRDDQAARAHAIAEKQARLLQQDEKLAERQEKMAAQHASMLAQNTAILESIQKLVTELHAEGRR